MEFGKIKSAVDNYITTAPVNERNKFLKEYSNMLHSDNILKEQFNVYTNLLYKNDDIIKENAVMYVDGNIDHLSNNFSIKQLKESNLKLLSLIKKYTEPNLERDSIMECIDDVVFNSMVNDGKRYINSFNTLVERFSTISENVNEGISTDMPLSMLSNIVTRKFNQKYEDLTESEKKLFKSIKVSDESEQEKVFVETRKMCIDVINGKLTESSIDEKEKLLEAKEIILDMSYNTESYVKDVLQINQLKENLQK